MAPSATTDADIAADAVFSRITAELQKAIAFGLVIVRSRLVVVEDAGHGGGSFGSALIDALESFKRPSR